MSDFSKVKSINVNTVFDKKTVKENLGTDLIRVTGIATHTIGATTKYGEQTGFGGSFMAVNLLTGELFESEAAFLPKGFTNELEKVLASGQDEIEVNMTIQAIESDKNDKGYAWIAVRPKTEKHLSLKQKLKENLLADMPKLLDKPKAKAKAA